MKGNFEEIIPLVFKDEGGYSNDPDDRGGPTKYGITIIDVRKYVNPKATADDVKKLTLDQARSIYKSKYWDALDCDNLSSGVDYTCVDYGINSGLGRPRAALNKFADKRGIDLINAINDERKSFLITISNPNNPKYAHNSKYRTGWFNRVERVRSKSLELAKKSVVAGSSTATTVAVATGGLAAYFQDHWMLILGGGIGAAVLTGLIIHLISNKGK